MDFRVDPDFQAKLDWMAKFDNEPHGAARTHIGMAKVAMAKASRDTPLAKMWMGVPMLAVADGPTEVHLVQVANTLLKNAKPAPGLFPSEHIPTKRAAARARFGDT
jgi:acyl-CoA dehydrogenase